MPKKMLVDASHPEETRVVVLDGNRVEEFDYESASRRPLKGNIYLAKVTRVEPSLQACFVEYGGNRHGFLAFSEIHPDYYQIPTADRQALLEATRAERREEFDDEPVQDAHASSSPAAHETHATEGEAQPAFSPAGELTPSPSEPANGADENDGVIVEVATSTQDDVWVHDPASDPEAAPAEAKEPASAEFEEANSLASEAAPELDDRGDDEDIESDAPEITPLEAAEAVAETKAVEGAGTDDAMEELPRRDYRSMRRYKIQEVIKRRQVLLVQVVKEERGNKGAALTTYLSLAGRYCVLMPNTDRGGGISRKISNMVDRRKLKEVAGELEVPEGMGVIIRTAGANRTKQEIKRDFEYLLRQWDAVRDLTLRSTAPTLVYEEGNLIKRTIRDLYSKDVDEISVEGDQGYSEAHSFMTMLMPSHADAVRHYRDPVPLFQRYGVEAALDGMFNPVVRLRSGGYIVINQTEALVAIDVNSGKATREHHIEDTALKTNQEAAEEIARQLRLRDLAGLIVIDFIDMEEHRNNRSVEKRLKDCLRHDRARIQLGRISPFGLLEMSRQRLRAGMIEGATIPCPHCEGRGVIRSVGSMALRVLRAVEEYCQREKLLAITLRIPPEIALYILNHKRAQLTAIEDRHGVYVYVESKPSLAASSYEIERGANVPFEPRKAAQTAVTVESELEANDDVRDDEDEVAEAPAPAESEERAGDGAQPGAPTEDVKRRRRRRRRGGRDRERERGPAQPPGTGPQPEAADEAPAMRAASEDEGDDEPEGDSQDEVASQYPGGAIAPVGGDDDGQPRRRRRGRRGRRGRRDGGFDQQQAPSSPIGRLPTPAEALDAPDWPATGGFDTQPGERPKAPRFERTEKPSFEPAAQRKFEPPRYAPTDSAADASSSESKPAEAKSERSTIASFFGFGAKPEPTPPSSPPPSAPAEASPPAESTDAESDDAKRERKGGWWQKRIGG